MRIEIDRRNQEDELWCLREGHGMVYMLKGTNEIFIAWPKSIDTCYMSNEIIRTTVTYESETGHNGKIYGLVGYPRLNDHGFEFIGIFGSGL